MISFQNESSSDRVVIRLQVFYRFLLQTFCDSYRNVGVFRWQYNSSVVILFRLRSLLCLFRVCDRSRSSLISSYCTIDIGFWSDSY